MNNKNYQDLLAEVGLSHLENSSPMVEVTEVEEMLPENDSNVVVEQKEVNGAPVMANMTIEAKEYNFLDIAKNLPVLKVSLIIWYIW